MLEKFPAAPRLDNSCRVWFDDNYEEDGGNPEEWPGLMNYEMCWDSSKIYAFTLRYANEINDRETEFMAQLRREREDIEESVPTVPLEDKEMTMEEVFMHRARITC